MITIKLTKKFLVMLLVLLIGSISTTFAGIVYKTIQVEYHGIKININRSRVSPELEPFIYSNRTFVPLRFIAEGLNKDVSWNNETKTIDINDKKPNQSWTNLLSAASVINGFKKAGLPIGKFEIYTESTDPNKLLGRPGQYMGKANWEDTRIQQDSTTEIKGGTVEIFDNEASLIKRKEYLEAFIQNPMFLQYMYIHKNVIVRIEKEIAPSQALEYFKALNTL